MSSRVNNKIRVGLLIDGFDVPLWEYKMIESINAGNYAEIVLIVKRKTPSEVTKNFRTRINENLKNGFFKLYTKIEKKIYKPTTDAFLVMNYQELVSSAAFLEVDCIEKKFSDYINDSDIALIKAYKIDVFIRLGFRILRGEILKTAKMGIWSYHHGDNYLYRGGPAVHWEVLKKEREVGSILQILTENLDGGEVLHRSWSSVEISATRTLNKHFWKTSLFIPRKLEELYERGEGSFFQKINRHNADVFFYSNRNYTIPTNIEFLKLFIPFLFDRVLHKFWKIFNFQQWILLYSFSKSNDLSTVGYRYKKLLPPKDRYWADPFAVYNNDKYYIFFEEVIYQKNLERGHISVAEIDKKGNLLEPVVILKQPYHLSYPFIFEHQGDYFMIPESEENSTVQLYKATTFPYEWEFKMNLMENVKAVDSTILYKDNKFWLFTSICKIEGGPYSDELFLFSSTNLFSQDWKPHPCNPVVSDVKSARPAGRIFAKGDKLYRPSQDCSFRYGYATILNEIIELNEENYSERKVSAITPDWADDVVATHTFTFDKGLSVIDATIKRRKHFFSIFRKR